jgi:hypothetical protein
MKYAKSEGLIMKSPVCNEWMLGVVSKSQPLAVKKKANAPLVSSPRGRRTGVQMVGEEGLEPPTSLV